MFVLPKSTPINISINQPYINQEMASLLSLPNEILIQVLTASPATRTLLRLANINHRMRSIWLEHSRRIIEANYKPKIQHIEQAITLTLTEVQHREIPASLNDDSLPSTAFESTPNHPPIRLYLPRMLRNAGLASAICEGLSKDNRIQKISWPTTDRWTEIPRAYYLIRHTALAYDHPQLRPAVLSTIAEASMAMLVVNTHVLYYLMRVASYKIRGAHATVERNWDAWSGTQRDPDQDRYRLADRWRAVSQVLIWAEYYHEIGIEEEPSFDVPDYDDEDL
jgi:hypothetical protein